MVLGKLLIFKDIEQIISSLISGSKKGEGRTMMKKKNLKCLALV